MRVLKTGEVKVTDISAWSYFLNALNVWFLVSWSGKKVCTFVSLITYYECLSLCINCFLSHRFVTVFIPC